MNLRKEKYDYKWMAITAFALIFASTVFFFFWLQTKILIRFVLEANFTYFISWAFTFLVFVFHYFRHKDKEVKSEIIFTKKFGAFMDNVFGGVAYGTTISTSLTLLKGLYIQQFFNDKKYFTEFNNIDLMTVFGVMIFLLYFSIMKVVDIAKETYKVQQTEQVLTEKKVIVKFNHLEDTQDNDD